MTVLNMLLSRNKETRHKVYGITGGIGSGKSVVSRILRCNGFFVYDCDYEARLLMERNTEVKEDLIKIFGKNIYKSDNSLNRVKMSEIIFSDKKKLESVNTIVHKAVKEDFMKICKNREDENIFIESAILFTSNLDSLCEQIWLIKAPKCLRIKRVQERSSLSIKAIRQRIKAQENEFPDKPDKKIKVIINDGRHSLLNETKKLL